MAFEGSEKNTVITAAQAAFEQVLAKFEEVCEREDPAVLRTRLRKKIGSIQVQISHPKTSH